MLTGGVVVRIVVVLGCLIVDRMFAGCHGLGSGSIVLGVFILHGQSRGRDRRRVRS